MTRVQLNASELLKSMVRDVAKAEGSPPATWPHSLERRLWGRAMAGKEPELKRLSDLAGGWVAWDPVLGEVRFIPMIEWGSMRGT